MDDFIWRIALSSDVPGSHAEIRSSWSFVDLLEAHLMVDLFEAHRKDHPGDADG